MAVRPLPLLPASLADLLSVGDSNCAEDMLNLLLATSEIPPSNESSEIRLVSALWLLNREFVAAATTAEVLRAEGGRLAILSSNSCLNLTATATLTAGDTLTQANVLSCVTQPPLNSQAKISI